MSITRGDSKYNTKRENFLPTEYCPICEFTYPVGDDHINSDVHTVHMKIQMKMLDSFNIKIVDVNHTDSTLLEIVKKMSRSGDKAEAEVKNEAEIKTETKVEIKVRDENKSDTAVEMGSKLQYCDICDISTVDMFNHSFDQEHAYNYKLQLQLYREILALDPSYNDGDSGDDNVSSSEDDVSSSEDEDVDESENMDEDGENNNMGCATMIMEQQRIEKVKPYQQKRMNGYEICELCNVPDDDDHFDSDVHYKNWLANKKT